MSSLTQNEIITILKKARRVSNHPGLDILIMPKDKPPARLLVITSKHSGNAPQRNKIRRRLKALFYEEKLFNYSFDCIIIVKKNGIELSFTELKELLKDILLNNPALIK